MEKKKKKGLNYGMFCNYLAAEIQSQPPAYISRDLQLPERGEAHPISRQHAGAGTSHGNV